MSGIIETVLRELGVNDEKIKEIRDTGITDKIYYDSMSTEAVRRVQGKKDLGEGAKNFPILMNFYAKIEDILSNNPEEFFEKMGSAYIQNKEEPASSLLKPPKKKGGGKRRRKSKKRKSKSKQSRKSKRKKRKSRKRSKTRRRR